MVVPKKKRAFSLVELIIVIVILGVIAAIAVPRISRGAKGADESAVRQDLGILRVAIEMYSAEHSGKVPGADGSEGTFKDQLLKYTDKSGNTSDTKTGLYDPDVVRALLKTVSLFPIGSHVALSDGRVGKVIRAKGADYDRPIIEAWTRGDPLANRTIIDLSDQEDLRITNTLARPG